MASIDDPELLRLRAAEMRSRADLAIYSETKQSLLRIADDFDVLAERAEKRMAGYVSIQPTESPPELAASQQLDASADSEGEESTTVG